MGLLQLRSNPTVEEEIAAIHELWVAEVGGPTDTWIYCGRSEFRVQHKGHLPETVLQLSILGVISSREGAFVSNPAANVRLMLLGGFADDSTLGLRCCVCRHRRYHLGLPKTTICLLYDQSRLVI